MAVKDKIVPLLSEGEYVSGGELAQKLGVSRAAIHKAIGALRAEGCDISALPNRGYRISGGQDRLDCESIKALTQSPLWRDIRVLDRATSTNTMLRALADKGEGAGCVLIAGEQTAGRGRRGREFFSPHDSGLYMSVLLRPDCGAADAALLTSAAAVAVCAAIEKVCGLKPGIKWVNDIFLDGKKVCGILTEAALNFESGTADYAVVGIGVNVYEPIGGFGPELSQIAGFLANRRQDGLRNRLAAAILNEFALYCADPAARLFVPQYRRRCIVIGRQVRVISASGQRPALAVGLDGDCRLEVKYEDGSEETLGSGEISVKLD